jgi:hypothetical protein
MKPQTPEPAVKKQIGHGPQNGQVFGLLKIFLKWVVHLRKNVRPSLDSPPKKPQSRQHWFLQT